MAKLGTISWEKAGLHLGGGRGGTRPPLEAGCPPLKIATIHIHNILESSPLINIKSCLNQTFLLILT